MIIACHVKKDVTAAEYQEAFSNSLSDRRYKAQKLNSLHKKCVSLAGGMLKRLVEEKQGFKYSNISHSGEYAVCIGENYPCGMDVQKIKIPSKRLVERVCTQKEIEALKNCSDMGLEFTKMWCIKEACFKSGIGKSLSEYFSENTSIEEQKKICSITAWQFNEKYVIACCVKNKMAKN